MAAPSLEESLATIERDADAAVRALTAALKAAKKVKTAAAFGQLRDLRQALGATAELAGEAASAATDLQTGWTFDEAEHFATGAYTAEVLDLAADQGVSAFESDGRILSYPVIVSIAAGDTTVVIDKKKDKRTRPTVLVRTLSELGARPPKFKPEAFLEALATAYDLVVAGKGHRPGSVAKLVDLHGVLTVLPGSSRDYNKQEFARDLYLLDQSGVTTTRSGRTLHLPASALTRGSGVLTTVSRSGQEKVYAGINFEDGDR